MNDVEQERYWWDSLHGDDIENNLHGFPPYDAREVAWMVLGMLQLNRGRAQVLDLGCGRGRLATAIEARRSVTEIHACDIAQSMLLKIEPSDRMIRPYLIDGRNLPSDLPLLDGAYSVTMFQHIPHEAQESYIQQVGEHLISGARFAFTVATGPLDGFLNHQVEMMQVIEWLRPLTPLHHFADSRGWQWFVAAKH